MTTKGFPYAAASGLASDCHNTGFLLTFIPRQGL